MRIDRTLEPLRAVASLFYPALCAICHAPVPRGDYICRDCLDKAPRIVAPFCAKCSEPFPGAIDGVFTCANCANRTLGFDAAVSAYRSRGLVRFIVLQFKYNRQLRLRHPIAEWLWEAMSDARLRQRHFHLVIPVPLHPARLRERGFNQAELVAKILAQKINVPLIRALQRIRYTTTQTAKERIESLLDPSSFVEMDANLHSVDTLRFQGMASYKDRLKQYQETTGLIDAVLSGYGMLEGLKVAIAVMDFTFLAATMGSVVGERVTRVIEFATAERIPIIIISASGGARMYEGMLSLMQMAKTSGALARHADARLPYISVLTNPTTAGVMASYASLGDIILAEPKSMIGFAGPRVIKETTHQDLPKGCQTAEFLEEHGLIDMIVHRKKMRETISQLLGYFSSVS